MASRKKSKNKDKTWDAEDKELDSYKEQRKQHSETVLHSALSGYPTEESERNYLIQVREHVTEIQKDILDTPQVKTKARKPTKKIQEHKSSTHTVFTDADKGFMNLRKAGADINKLFAQLKEITGETNKLDERYTICESTLQFIKKAAWLASNGQFDTQSYWHYACMAERQYRALVQSPLALLATERKVESIKKGRGGPAARKKVEEKNNRLIDNSRGTTVADTLRNIELRGQKLSISTLYRHQKKPKSDKKKTD